MNLRICTLAIVCFSVNFYAKKAPKAPAKKALSGYAMHLEASKKFNVKAIADSRSLKSSKKAGILSPVKMAGRGYRIERLDYSKPVLLPQAKRCLYAISKDFYKKSGGNTLCYTSLTRTIEDQEKLRRVNRNAAEGLSCHNFGNSFDISYVRFNDKIKTNPSLDKILEKTLAQYQNSGKIYFIKEKRQRCYHVTVRG